MIYEVRIFSRNGSSIYASKLEIKKGKIVTQPIALPSLFSSMMSAILSFDSEVGRSQVREFIYEQNKAVLHFLDEISFLVYADIKVSNADLENFLRILAKSWLKDFEDREYIYFDNNELKSIAKKVQKAVKDVFWWIGTYPTPRNVFNVGFKTITRPNSTYYVRYLSNYYHVFSFVIPLLSILLAQFLGVVISGFSPRSVESPSQLTVGVPILVLWLGPGLFLKAIYGGDFHIRAFYTISGLMTIFLFPVMFLSSDLYNLWLVSLLADFGIFQQIAQIFLLLAPINLAFFGYFLATGFATSFSNEVKQGQFQFSYVLIAIFLISLTSVIAV